MTIVIPMLANHPVVCGLHTHTLSLSRKNQDFFYILFSVMYAYVLQSMLRKLCLVTEHALHKPHSWFTTPPASPFIHPVLV